MVVTYGGDPVPKSPFTVGVAPPLDLSKVKVQGLNSSECGSGMGGVMYWGVGMGCWDRALGVGLGLGAVGVQVVAGNTQLCGHGCGRGHGYGRLSGRPRVGQC